MNKNEMSLMIEETAKSILPITKFDEVIGLCEKYNNKKSKLKVQRILWDLLDKNTPDCEINAKQLDYAKYDLEHLDERTRDITERAAASIEAICATIWE